MNCLVVKVSCGLWLDVFRLRCGVVWYSFALKLFLMGLILAGGELSCQVDMC